MGKEREKRGGALKGEHSHSCTSKPQSIRQMLQLTILIRNEKNLFHQSFERRGTDKQGGNAVGLQILYVCMYMKFPLCVFSSLAELWQKDVGLLVEGDTSSKRTH